IGLDQLVQGRRRVVARFHRQEQPDRLVADLLAHHLSLVFTHRSLPLARSEGPEVYPCPQPVLNERRRSKEVVRRRRILERHPCPEPSCPSSCPCFLPGARPCAPVIPCSPCVA